ncbi:MAG: RimK-like ATPgrasp N-terminal domain-containing protein, partial [Gammaproteobacteria bacterium]|nr:RimK-like ATPgrasp N-terminal domain-containing protein [Gammaproteobacteria bacterium]
MTETLIVTELPEHACAAWPALPRLSPDDYLTQRERVDARGQLVVNLAPSYRYLSAGYYCSLLAEARSQRVIPSVRTIEDLSRKTLYGLAIQNLPAPAAGSSHDPPDTHRLVLHSYFGFSSRPEFDELCRRLFERFPAPILRIELRNGGNWHVGRLALVPRARLPESEREVFAQAFQRFVGRRWRRRTRRPNRYRYDLA